MTSISLISPAIWNWAIIIGIALLLVVHEIRNYKRIKSLSREQARDKDKPDDWAWPSNKMSHRKFG